MTKQDAPTTTDAARSDFEAHRMSLNGGRKPETWAEVCAREKLQEPGSPLRDKYFLVEDRSAWAAFQAGIAHEAARASSAAAQPVEPSKPLYAQLADSLRPFLKPGDKVIWRMPFRWHDDNGVMPNHYDGHELEGLAADFGYQIDWDFNLRHAAIVRAAPPAKPADTGEASNA